MPTEVYKYNTISEEYELVATWNEDGTYSGSGVIGSRLDKATEVLEHRGETPSDYYEGIRDRLLAHWNNGVYRTVTT